MNMPIIIKQNLSSALTREILEIVSKGRDIAVVAKAGEGFLRNIGVVTAVDFTVGTKRVSFNLLPGVDHKLWEDELRNLRFEKQSNSGIIQLVGSPTQLEDLTLVPPTSYAHISNEMMGVLLTKHRLLKFDDYPAELKGQDVPNGIELINEIARRLGAAV